ncbi:LacI family transcriptional regulator [Clostridia bacterium]|nr:LacI family transcriptional regulator [Clostridia bacterium]
MAATMKDLAIETGLSLRVISKYFNGKPLRAANREKIEKAIIKCGYEINETARSLKTQKSYMVGVILPRLKNTYFTMITEIVQAKLSEAGYGTVVMCNSNDRAKQDGSIQFLLSKRVDAMLIVPADTSGRSFENAKKRNIPVVLLDKYIPDDYCDAIVINNREICRAAMKKLLGYGHTKIAVIVGNEGMYTADDRLAGCKAAFGDAGLPLSDDLITRTELRIPIVAEKVTELLKARKDITAIFASNYESMLGSIIALNRLNLSVPDDISLFGFDNLEFVDIVRPRLHIVAQPVQKIGEAAADILLKRLRGEMTGEGKMQVFDAEIMDGASIKDLR